MFNLIFKGLLILEFIVLATGILIFPKPFISGLDMEGTDKGYLGYKLSKAKAIDIDTQEDWDLAEALYKLRNY